MLRNVINDVVPAHPLIPPGVPRPSHDAIRWIPAMSHLGMARFPQVTYSVGAAPSEEEKDLAWQVTAQRIRALKNALARQTVTRQTIN
jgi:hypothetical protein